MDKITIIALQQSHYDDWLPLYHGYAAHYETSLSENGIATTWKWLMDSHHPTTGIVAVGDGAIVGLAHYRAMPSPLRGCEVGFLDDIFVSPTARGARVGELLLQRLREIARENGWSVVRWITRDNNYRARALYDRIATKSDFNLYEMKTD